MRVRTYREAINDGTAFHLEREISARPGHVSTWMFPAAETPEEAAEMARNRGEIPGTVFQVYRLLPQSHIGCEFLEHIGVVTVPEFVTVTQ